MTTQVRLSPKAEQDILGIWEYVAADSIAAADHLLDRLTHLYEKLAQQDPSGFSQEQYRPALRCFPVGRYVFFYSVRDGGVEVYRVLYGARHLEDLF